MARKRKSASAPGLGYPVFPFDVDRGLDVWISGMDRYAGAHTDNPESPVRSTALALREALFALQRELGMANPKMFELVERVRAMRLEAYAIEQGAELGKIDQVRKRGGKAAGDAQRKSGAVTAADVASMAAKLRAEGVSERNLKTKVAERLGRPRTTIGPYLRKK